MHSLCESLEGNVVGLFNIIAEVGIGIVSVAIVAVRLNKPLGRTSTQNDIFDVVVSPSIFQTAHIGRHVLLHPLRCPTIIAVHDNPFTFVGSHRNSLDLALMFLDRIKRS